MASLVGLTGHVRTTLQADLAAEVAVPATPSVAVAAIPEAPVAHTLAIVALHPAQAVAEAAPTT